MLEASRDDAGAFVDAFKLSMDTGFRNISNDLAHDLYGSGTGSRGNIGTIVTNGVTNAVTITLSDPQQVTQFEVGMVLVSSATDGSTPSTDTVTITGVNRPGGVLTGTASVTPSSTLSATWIATAFLYVQGDIASTGSTTTSSFLKVTGLNSWMPIAAVAPGDSFWGVDRSRDSRLQGVFYNGTSQSIEEALIDAASLVAREGGQPDTAFMSFASYSALEKSLGSKVQYISVKHDLADIAFEALRVQAPYGPINVLPDRNATSQRAYLLQMDTWKFRSLNKSPHILTYGVEGLEGARIGDNDALQVRIGYYGNLICNAPGWNCVVQLSA